MHYNHKEIDQKWQKYWEENKTFRTPDKSDKPKYYILDMFPYPSGKGLHVGHPKGYVGSDVYSRYKRMRGFNVLHPMGWDAFGLPSERQATLENLHPSIITKRNVKKFKEQLQIVGLSYDWDREINTSKADYYKWTQWIFLKLYEKGLAYQAEVAVNWCPALGTVLANEEVKDGEYVETGDPVEKRLMKQWMFKITEYSDRLIEDLDLVDWPESIKEMQRNWIGKSIGARVTFEIADTDKSFDIFTTRPDTLFGCTYCVLAPEHELITSITSAEQKAEVESYVDKVKNMSERDRMQNAGNEKTGVFTGSYAICPVNGEKIPIWISDYVLTSYGTGAVFACPAHDDRDYEFATKFSLPITEVVKGGDVSKEAYTGDGPHVNSDFLNDLKIDDAKEKIIGWLEENNSGKSETNYKLRDWLFSRQRYWGEPFPILIDENENVSTVPENELPVLLPELEDFSPTADGKPPLARAEEWLEYTDEKTGKKYVRETNTMPQWAGSCWYYLRFIDPDNSEKAWDPEKEKYWLPVDLYIGGTEHATLHLLYARFWHKVLYDMGYVSHPEPFKKLFNQGMILAKSFKDSKGKYFYPEEVEEKSGKWFAKDSDEELLTKLEKMSKSKKNVVTPEQIVEEYGADSLRLYEMFLGPLQDSAIWQTENILGIRRFLDKIWRLFTEESTKGANYSDKEKAIEMVVHKTIKKVTEDIEGLNTNTAVSQLMIMLNELNKLKEVPKEIKETLLKLLSPFAPHLCEELWLKLGNETSISFAEWPEFDPAKTIDETINLPVQVSGKMRGTISIERDASQETAEALARKVDNINKYLADKEIRKIIFVPNKILNIIVSK